MRHATAIILALALLACTATAWADTPRQPDPAMSVVYMDLPEYQGCTELRLWTTRGEVEVECVLASCVLPNSQLMIPVVTLLFCDPAKEAKR